LVASVIEGLPIICEDYQASQVEEVCHKEISDIARLKPFDRDLWIKKIAQCHWSFKDLRDGIAWQHMKKYLKI
jgi:hypothetical protein